MMREKISEIISSIMIAIFGLCLILWADKVTNLVSIILGISFAVIGIVRVINYYRFKETNTLNLILGIITIVIGGVLIFKADLLKEILSFVIGLYITLSSITSLIASIKLQKVSYTKLSKSIILSIIGIIAGVLCFIGKVLIPDIFLQIIGVMMLIYGITNIINTLILNNEMEF